VFLVINNVNYWFLTWNTTAKLQKIFYTANIFGKKMRFFAKKTAFSSFWCTFCVDN